MRLIIEDASPEFEAKLLELIAEHRAGLALSADTEWNEERAATLYRMLPRRAARILREAALNGGYVDASLLREEGKGLRGQTGAITQALKRGVRLGWWPEGMPRPLEPDYNPEIAGVQRTLGYHLPDAHLPAFRAAIERAVQDSAHPERD